MKNICIVHDTDGKRNGGHLTEYAFNGLQEVFIVGFADANPENQKEFVRTGAAHRYLDWREMIEKEHPDICVFCSRLPSEHEEQLTFAIEHGCHVLCEKPLASSLEQADAIVSLAKQKNILIQVAHLARFAPQFQTMRTMIADGAIGRPLTCYMRGKEDHRSGGEDMLVLGSHLMDVACQIFGLPDSVMSDVRQNESLITKESTKETVEPLGPCAGDDIFAQFHWRNGMRGVFESRCGMTDVKRDHTMRMGITVVGTTGTLAIRYGGDRALRLSRSPSMPMEDAAEFTVVPVATPPSVPDALDIDYEKMGIDPANLMYVYFAENNRRAAWNLLQAVNGKEELTASAESALDSLEMIQGIYRSSIEGRRLALPQAERKHPLMGR